MEWLSPLDRRWQHSRQGTRSEGLRVGSFNFPALQPLRAFYDSADASIVTTSL